MRVNRLIESTVKQVSEKEVKNILDNITTNNNRYNKSQFEKLFNQGNLWVGVFEGDECKAMASLVEDRFNIFNTYYLNEIQSFEKGYGKILMDNLLKHDIWLLADPRSDQKLVDYYRKLGLDEINFDDSIWNKPITFFTNIKNNNKLKQLIDALTIHYK